MLWRGSLIVIQTDFTKSNSRDFVGGGTLVDAIFWAKEQNPNKRYVHKVAQSGLENCVDLATDTPSWMIDWLVREANSWHGGSFWTIVEAYEDAIKAENGWNVFKAERGISVASCPSSGPFCYDKQYDKFVFSAWDPKMYWPNWSCFKSMLQFKHKMDTHECWNALQWFYEEEADYTAEDWSHEASPPIEANLGIKYFKLGPCSFS